MSSMQDSVQGPSSTVSLRCNEDELTMKQKAKVTRHARAETWRDLR